MGINDRDYVRKPAGGGFGMLSMWSITTWLIVINVAVFVLDAIMGRSMLSARGIANEDIGWRGVPEPLVEWGAFSVDAVLHHFEVWRLITCQFLHAGVQHLLSNMIGLYFFGPMVELYLGAKRYLWFYLICGVAGPVMFTALYYLGAFSPGGIHPGFFVPEVNSPLIGASAGIFGILVAAAVFSPNQEISLWFPPVTIKLKWIAMGALAIAVYTILTFGNNEGGEAAHLGGGIMGFVLAKNYGLLDFVPARRKVKRRVGKDWSKDLDR